ncbi:hypothetical protein GCM10009817_17090 [Terrabacter lapilli]|uniref:Superfamily III holin-X n=1 Tax=Terrabacter lapilli TaxID=436231 RepID=A0ABN2RZ25_9MICO
MTTSEVAGDSVERAPVSSALAPALGRLVEAAVQAAAAKLSHKVDRWIRRIEEYTASEGAAGRAALEGLKAHLLGKNPVWAAMKGAWAGASVPLRVVAVLVLLLTLLLAPVVVVLLLLGLLVAAIVAAIRAATR